MTHAPVTKAASHPDVEAPALPLLARPALPGVYPDAEAWHDPAQPRARLIDPATEAPRALLPLSRGWEVDAAVARARAYLTDAQPVDRAALLERLIARLQHRHEALAQAVCTDIGAPIDFARAKQVDAAIAHLQATLNALRAAPERETLAPGGHEVAHVPAGVAALITPWNWPLNQVALKVGGALAAGCALILKPSELATGAALLFAECMAEAGAPEGLFTLLVGDGDTGARLAAHPGLDIVSFTGSTPVGRAIAAAAGANLVPVLLELGGKSANLLFEDCDLETAVRQGVAHCFRNSGQSCNAAARMLVARPLYDRAVALAAAEAACTAMGLPEARGPHLGPLVSSAQFARVQHHIAGALEDGARCVAGGPGRHPGHTVGYYPRPTVFADVTPQMRIFHEEVFGPVLTLTPFETEDDAIALANATPYGLAGYVQTADPARQRRVADALRVGMVQINGRSRAEGAPFGGVGQSGFGREAGLWGIRAFQTVKSLNGFDPL